MYCPKVTYFLLLVFSFLLQGFALRKSDDTYDYVVIGSGPGGGPLAANLARKGFEVLLLEAGDDVYDFSNVEPILLSFGAENPRTSWNFYVQHYDNKTQAENDSKFVEAEKGVLYPRAATLGGCALHNAFLMFYPQNEDFDEISSITGDSSWKGNNMRKYWQRIERNQYTIQPSPWDRETEERQRVGFDGWQSVDQYDWSHWESIDPQLQASRNLWPISSGFSSLPGFDPNRFDNVGKEGYFSAPLSLYQGFRSSHYQYLKKTQNSFPDKLFISLNSVATKIIFKEHSKKAIGVRYAIGKSIYKADPRFNSTTRIHKKLKEAKVRREVIVAGGTFNSPQILKLSGVGPKKELRRLGIPVIHHLPGVGKNMHDRYEISLNLKLKNKWVMGQGCQFKNSTEDPCYQTFLVERGKKGLYGSNGVLMASVHRSKNAKKNGDPPNVAIFSGATYFSGYYPGYSLESAVNGVDTIATVILLAHVKNRGGTVELRSKDPLDVPKIRFRYFTDGGTKEDIEDMQEAVRYVREQLWASGEFRDYVLYEYGPMAQYQRDRIDEGVRNEAWGHHACCSNPMLGHKNSNSVVDENFKVVGLENVRIVDASVFPNIPGTFIVSAIYIISEKATDAILADAGVPPYSL